MNPEFISLSILILLFSVILHEVMHGMAALKFGDHTAERAGRLTLNPIPHIDPIGTIVLPLILILTNSPILFGWAKPVPVNPLNFTNLKKGELVVASAGILSNLGLALTAAVAFHIVSIIYPQGLLLQLIDYTVNINVILAVLNLIPVPPLDGSKILISILPYRLAKPIQSLEQYGFVVFLLLMLIPFGNGTLVSFILNTGVGLFRQLVGL